MVPGFRESLNSRLRTPQSPANAISRPQTSAPSQQTRRQDGVTGEAGARGVPEQEPVRPAQGERGQHPDNDEGQLELQESNRRYIPAPGP